jgi:hypothetical protein
MTARSKAVIAIAVILLSLVTILAVGILLKKASILRYTAEAVIRSVLPDYVSVDRISFDLAPGRITLHDFRIANPPDYRSRHLIEIGEISCRYRMKGGTILDGIEITDPVFIRAVLNIERQSDGSTNLRDMALLVAGGSQGRGKGMPSVSRAREEARQKGARAGRAYGAAAIVGKRAISDVVKLPESYEVKDGTMAFYDKAASRGRPVSIVISGIAADLRIRLNPSYSGITDAASTGSGYINGNRGETVEWTVDYNPAAPKLTMSNRFNVYNLDIKLFEPYYDAFSPVVFASGRISGTIVLDFDSGNIGSTNELHLSDLRFSVKPGQEDAAFWGSTVPELVKYFTKPYGDVVFDFKIKGDIANPRFMLGPISKRAMATMAVDKVANVISAAARASEATPAAGEGKDEAQARALAGALKQLLKK